MSTERVRVGVVGASGYSGTLAARILARHPRFELAFATSDLRRGRPLAHLGIRGAGVLVANGEACDRASDCGAVVLATPPEVSQKLAPELRRRHSAVVVCDLSNAFRLGDEAHYGLPELFGRPVSMLVANPGCYPTATLCLLAPLVASGLVEPEIAVDAKSGTTGAGRQAKEEHSFAEVDENLRAYKIHNHQHEPEIAAHLARRGGTGVEITFVPHLLPVRRGILITAYARLRAGIPVAAPEEALRAFYKDSRFVRVVAPHEVSLAEVVGTNDVAVAVSVRGRSVVGLASIDNLLKGASGQAVQNLNLAFGLAEDAGLDHLERSAP